MLRYLNTDGRKMRDVRLQTQHAVQCTERRLLRLYASLVAFVFERGAQHASIKLRVGVVCAAVLPMHALQQAADARLARSVFCRLH